MTNNDYWSVTGVLSILRFYNRYSKVMQFPALNGKISDMPMDVFHLSNSETFFNETKLYRFMETVSLTKQDQRNL